MTVQPEPDGKDWTWVLDERCPECGFDCRAPGRSELASLAEQLTTLWDEVMRSTGQATVRPAPAVWSPLEYACHVRDVFELASERVALMRSEDEPHFANWDQDETALAQDYPSQDPGIVREQLKHAGREFASTVAAVPADAWGRTGLRGDGADFTVESFIRYLLHDVAHHLTDVSGQRWD